ncbi:MAG TPA: universal stress protein [Methanothrix soehngenii]|jgi:nucleotide-binding universal stress UspA family protein|nr:universal stress protein [Methanothrix soehngenii]
MIKKIMVATDGSDASRKAAMVAVDIARQAVGSITAVYVMETERLSHLPGLATLPELSEKILALMQEEGQQATQFVEDQAKAASVPCRKILARGRASEELIKISKQQGIDLLVMGSMGRTGMEKILLGDVAEKVVHQSAIPVLLAR